MSILSNLGEAVPQKMADESAVRKANLQTTNQIHQKRQMNSGDSTIVQTNYCMRALSKIIQTNIIVHAQSTIKF